MEGLEFRDLKEEELEDVLFIERSSFDVPWTRAQILDEFKNRDITWPRGAYEEWKLVGYLFLWFIVDECHVANIAVHPDFRRRGVGWTLLEECIRLATQKKSVKITLEVRTSNRGAISLYDKFGFQKVGIRKNYYRDGFLRTEDAILMDFTLPQQTV